MNIFDILLILLIAVSVIFAVRRIISDRKKGGCCGCCNACTGRKYCNKKGETVK